MADQRLFDILAQESSKFGVEITREMFEKFDIYRILLQEWNEKMNLTAIIDDESIMVKHFADSVSIVPFVRKIVGPRVKIKTVTLDMATALKITQQPTVNRARSAEGITVSVSAEGDGLSYCWYSKGAEDEIFIKTSVTGSVYTMSAGDHSQDRYIMCVVSDQYGNWLQSDTVLLKAW